MIEQREQHAQRNTFPDARPSCGGPDTQAFPLIRFQFGSLGRSTLVRCVDLGATARPMLFKEVTNLSRVVTAFESLRSAGKIRAWGVSATWRTSSVFKKAIAARLISSLTA